METIYVDNNATTPVAPEVHAALQPYLTGEYYNPSSMYERARHTATVLSGVRKTIAQALGGIDPDELIFTSCATESNNTALFGAARANEKRRHVITSAVEHPAILEVGLELQRRGFEVTFLPVDSAGRLDAADLARALKPGETLMVTIMHANNETGVIFPIGELARITKETDPEILFHTDATQSFGKLAIDLRGEFKHVDMLSFSGHKMHAPKGIGALYVKRGVRWRPFMIGGHQERSRRAGTENVPYIAGLGKAVELAFRDREAEAKELGRLRDRLESELVEKIPYVQVNGAGAPRLPNTLNLACHYIEGEGILYQLDSHGICASSGSACTSGSLEPSHVLRAMHVPFTAVHGSVRFSLSRYNTEPEIEKIIAVFPEIVANLRKLSPYWDRRSNQPTREAIAMSQRTEEAK